MKNTLKLSVIAALVALLSGCGEDLKPKVAALEAELAKEKSALVATNAELAKEKAALVAANAELAKEKAAFSVVSAKVALAEKLEADRKAEADKKSTLTVQVGLTMRSGDTKPVSNTKVYLTKKKSSDYLGDIEVVDNDGKKESKGIFFTVWAKGLGEWSSIYSTFAQKAYDRLKSETVAVSDTDFNGTASFEDIPKGEYYAICVTPLGGGAVLEKRISVSTSKVKVALSNADSLE